MLLLDCVKNKKKKKNIARDQNGVDYCPFSVLGRDTTVVSQQEGQRHARQACLPAQSGTCAHARAGEPRKACRDKPPWALCRDREIPYRDREGQPYVATKALVSQHGFG